MSGGVTESDARVRTFRPTRDRELAITVRLSASDGTIYFR